jgi:pyruvate/2-oxoglutarate dehydrogenase complex dihydrolipoamide acyltransferase (E2) component
MLEVVVPELGIAPTSPLVVSCWLADVGEEVVEGDRLVELMSGEITLDVPAPGTGRLVKVAAGRNRRVRPGAVLGWIEPDDEVD